MPTNFVPFVVLWSVMAAVVLALVVWRKIVSSKEDDNIHVLDSGAVAKQQTQIASKLDLIDKWGKILTVVTLVFGVVLAAFFIYQGWINGAKIVE